MKYTKFLILSLLLLFSFNMNSEALASEDENAMYYELSTSPTLHLYSPDGEIVDFFTTYVPGIEMLDEGHYLIYTKEYLESGYYFYDDTQEDIKLTTFDHKSKQETSFVINQEEEGEKIIIEDFDNVSSKKDNDVIKHIPSEINIHEDFTFKVTTKEKSRDILTPSIYLAIFILVIFSIIFFYKKRKARKKLFKS